MRYALESWTVSSVIIATQTLHKPCKGSWCQGLTAHQQLLQKEIQTSPVAKALITSQKADSSGSRVHLTTHSKETELPQRRLTSKNRLT